MTGQGFTFDPDSSDPCPNCGEPYKEHPTLNVSKVNMLALCSHRHPKWEAVEPGTVIPAGQPYRVEHPSNTLAAEEFLGETHDWEPNLSHSGGGDTYFVDSTWKPPPPLVLPTEPTWGIPVVRFPNGNRVSYQQARWHLDPDDPTKFGQLDVDSIVDFILLTDDQIARLEAAR